MSQLSQYACSPVREGEPPLSPEELERLLPLVPSWALITDQGVRKLQASFSFDSASKADEFVDRLEKQGEDECHPVEIRRDHQANRVTVLCYTSELGGLHPNDFILAARADGAWSQVLVGQQGEMDTGRPLPHLYDAERFREVLLPERLPQE